MEHIDYSKFLPIYPPKSLLDEAEEKGLLNKAALVYRVAYIRDPITGLKEKVMKVTCSKCGDVSYYRYIGPGKYGFWRGNEQIYDGDTTMCESCGTPAQAFHVQKIKNDERSLLTLYPLFFTKVHDSVAAISWNISLVVDKEGRQTIRTLTYESYVFSGRKCLKYRGYRRPFTNIVYTNDWMAFSKAIDTYGVLNDFLSYTDEVFIGSSLENSKFKEYIESGGKYPITYLKTYLRHKNVENLVTSGLSNYIDYNVCHNYYCSFFKLDDKSFVWKERKPHAMLRMNKAEFKEAKRRQWKPDMFCYCFHLRAKDLNASLDAVETCHRFSAFSTIESMIRDGVPYLKVVNYLLRQKKYDTMNHLISYSYYCDYKRMALAEGVDLSIESNLYPKNLVARHNALAENQRLKKEKGLAERFEARKASLEKYSFVDESLGLLIRPCFTAHELFAEGSELHHCVNSYAERHCNGETAIFFIRHIDAPDKPYFTLEFNEMNLSVVQNRGLRNCCRSEEVVVFEAEWIKHVKDMLKRKKVKHG